MEESFSVRSAVRNFHKVLDKMPPIVADKRIVEVTKKEPSPFQEYADREGFILVYVERSYKILSAIDIRIPNYYELCEKKAKEQPELAADLYAYLREGMHMTPEQFKETHNNLAAILC